MKEYKVQWEIEIPAHSPEEAAKLALEIHRDPNSTATSFEVIEAHACQCGRCSPWYTITVDTKED